VIDKVIQGIDESEKISIDKCLTSKQNLIEEDHTQGQQYKDSHKIPLKKG
jgi:hypothetical protein